MVASYVGTPIFGGFVINPAVGTAIPVVSCYAEAQVCKFDSQLHHLWVYWAGPVLGALLSSVYLRVCGSS